MMLEDLSPEEQQLVSDYNELNQDGKRELQEILDLIVQTQAYTNQAINPISFGGEETMPDLGINIPEYVLTLEDQNLIADYNVLNHYGKRHIQWIIALLRTSEIYTNQYLIKFTARKAR